MKRFLLVLLVVVFSPFQAAYAQMAVADTALFGITNNTMVEQIAYFGKSVYNQLEQITHLRTQIEHAYQQTKMAVQNLKGLQDIDSWDDFKDWYNRELYLGKASVESIKGMNVTIGKKNYSLFDLQGIADGIDETYIKYWEKEFTEEQRKEIWLKLGLTPANYAYVQPYITKAKEIAREFLTMLDIQNRKNMKTSLENKEDRDALKRDTRLPDDQQMGDKELQQRQLAALNRISETMIDISTMQAKQMEAQGIEEAIKRTPVSQPPLSKWGINGFIPVEID